MRPYLNDPIASQLNSIPLLDASSLPSNDDWALLESINVYAEPATDFEPDHDRYGRVRVSEFYDE
jgi:hypothetical protein